MVEGLAYSGRVAYLKDDIPETVGKPVAQFLPLRAMVVEVMPFDIAEVRAAKVIEVHRVMNPFLKHVALHHAGQQNGECVNRRNKTHWRGNNKQWKQVPQLSVDVVAVKGMCVVFPVEGVQAFVQKLADNSLSRCKVPMQNKTVKQVLDESPDGHARSAKNDRHKRVRRAKRTEQHGQTIGSVKDGHRIQSLP